MARIITYAFYLTNLLIVVGSIVFTYLYWIEANPPVKYTNLPFPVEKQVYVAGETVQFKIEACGKKRIPFTVIASIIDGFIINFDSFDSLGISEGCHAIVSHKFILPDFLPSGEYQISGSNIFHINLLRDRIVDWETETFRIIQAPLTFRQ